MNFIKLLSLKKTIAEDKKGEVFRLRLTDIRYVVVWCPVLHRALGHAEYLIAPFLWPDVLPSAS